MVPTANPSPEHKPSILMPDPYDVNMLHLELFNNLLSKDFLAAERQDLSDSIPHSIYLERALQTPYLMSQALATSALHLSIRNTSKAYRDHIDGFQARALSLFNQLNPKLDITPSNSVDMFLFSSLLSVHLLAETLVRHKDSFHSFISHFTNNLGAARGVRAVVNGAYSFLDTTILGPALTVSRENLTQDPNGSDCDPLWHRISIATARMDPARQDAYRSATQALRRVFKTQARACSDAFRLTQAVLAWPDYLTTTFEGLLRRMDPIALVILAHYAVLLYRGRHLWLFGDGGRFIIESVSHKLGAEWLEWLDFPKAALLGSDTDDDQPSDARPATEILDMSTEPHGATAR